MMDCYRYYVSGRAIMLAIWYREAIWKLYDRVFVKKS